MATDKSDDTDHVKHSPLLTNDHDDDEDRPTTPDATPVQVTTDGGNRRIRFDVMDDNADIVKQPPHSVGGSADRSRAALLSQDSGIACKLSKRRWPMLILFCLFSMSNSYQWIQYSILTDVVTEYYSVPSLAVYWTSMIYEAMYIPLIFPATWFLDRSGLRAAVLVGASGNAIGTAIKCFSAMPDRFWLTFIGQTISGMSQIFVLNIPARLGAVWFGHNEVSTAVSIGVFGNQLGVAAGFLLPPMIVPACNQTASIACSEEIGNNLFKMFLATAIVAAVLLVLIIAFFRDHPPFPPSISRGRLLECLQNAEPVHYWDELKRLAFDCNFRLLFIAYGINVGCYYAIGTLLNQIVLDYFPGEQLNAGRIGLVIVIAGLVGSVVCGYWLDRTKSFKSTTLGVYVLSFSFMLIFALTLEIKSMPLVFATAGALGFFMTGYLPVGFEFGVELTYPIGEGTSSGMLNASAQIFGILLTTGLDEWIKLFDVRTGNLSLSVALLIGCFLTCLIKSELKRLSSQRFEQLPTGDQQQSTAPVVSGQQLATTPTTPCDDDAADGKPVGNSGAAQSPASGDSANRDDAKSPNVIVY